MAKEKSELTDAQKATLDARQKLETARKAHAEKETEATKKAVASAEEHFRKCVSTENRERFVRVAGGRVKKARAAIRNLASVAAPRSYNYNEDDVKKAETALTSEVNKAISAMRAALQRGGTAKKAEDDFTF